MPIFQRSAFLYRDVYIEGTSPKNQMYCYNPEGFYRYNENNPAVTDGAGYLEYLVLPSFSTIQDFIQFGDSLIQPLLNSTDIGLIYGDIVKAYGSAIITLPSIPEVVPFQPIKDIGVLEQIHNATIVGGDKEGAQVANSVVQDSTKSILLSNPVYVSEFTGNALSKVLPMQAFCENRILTTRTEYTDVSLVAESTRLMVTAKASEIELPESSADYPTVPLICGTEIATDCTFYTWNYTSTGRNLNRQSLQYVQYFVEGVGRPSGAYSFITKSSAFDFHPLMHVYLADSATNMTKLTDIGMCGAMDNIAVVQPDVLARLHETCILSLYNVTPIAKL